MRRPLGWLSACALLACTSGSPDARSTLTLTITSSLEVPLELDLVTVRVSGQESANDPAADLLQRSLPRTLTLVHESGPLGPFPVTVRGYHGTELVIRRDVNAAFPDSGNRDLTINLDRICKNVVCVPSETCELGLCVPIGSEPDDAGVDAATRDAATRDAAREDAATGDAGPLDAGADAADARADDGAIPDDASVDVDAMPAADAATDAATDAGQVDAGAPPSCSLALPVTGDAYQTGVLFPLQGSCSDPETGVLSELTWLSSRDGLLGNGASIEARLTTADTHRISLCAPDPRDATVVGCASADIVATRTPQPAASITSVSQGTMLASPYRTGSALSLAGAASGAGITLSWSDDMQGALGGTASAQLATPFVGRHTATLTVRDRNGVEQSATRGFVVLGVGETNLVSPLTAVNAELDRAGDLPIANITSDPSSRAYVPSSSGVWYRFDGNILSASATVAVGQPPLRNVVQDAQISAGASYLATRDGLTVCGYSQAAGAAEPCTNYRAGGVLQSQNFLSVLRMVDSANVDILMVGADSGLFLSESVNGSVRGSTILRGRSINDMAALGSQAALALDNGLTLLTPSTQQQVRFTVGEGLPSNQLRSLAVASDGTLWIASAGGLAHFEPGSNRITAWTRASGLPSDSCNGVAVQHVTQLSPARDVVWVATTAGVVRLDTLTNALTRFTSADGLPSDNVLAAHVLANGIKLFGTQSGLAHYVGF